MGVGYSIPKESSLNRFLAISLESPEIIGVIEPKLTERRCSTVSDGIIAKEAVGGERKTRKDGGGGIGPSAGLIHRLIRKQWQAGIDRVLRRGPQLTVHLGASPFSFHMSPSLGSPTASELAEVRDFLCRLIVLLENENFRLEASPYSGKMFVRNTLIFSTPKEGEEEEEGEKRCHYALDPSECVVWVGIRSKSVLQLSQSAMGQYSHCCPPQFTPDSDDEASLIRWIRTEFSGAKIVHCPGNSSPTSDLPCPGNNRPKFIEIHFQGQPFASQKFDEFSLITARRLFLGLFRHFYARGFSFCAQFSARGCGKNDTVVFRKLHPPPDPISDQRQLFLLSFESKCHLRFFECPPEAAKIIEQIFSDNNRIKQIRPSWMGCSEIIFSLPIFWADQGQLLDTQLAILEMFSALWRAGWKYSGLAQIGQGNQDKVSLVFESAQGSLAPSKIFGLSLSRADQLRLLDAPASLRAAIRVMLEAEWEKGIQEEVPAPSSSSSDRIFTFKLRGRPWSCRDNSLEASCGLHLLIFIYERLHRMGWQFLCSLDAGAKVNDDDDAHLYCEDGELLIFCQKNGQNEEMTAAIQPSAPLEEREEAKKGAEEGEGELGQIAQKAGMAARMARMSTV